MPLLDDKTLLKRFVKDKNNSRAGNSRQYKRGKENHAFHAGDEMSYAATVNDKGRKKMVVFNKVKPYIDAVCGFMIQLRRKPQYSAKVFDNILQQNYSDYMNSLSDTFRAQANIDSIETRQDREMLVAGIGAIDTNIIYENNPDGEIAGEVIKLDDLGYDHLASAPNLMDARFVYRRKVYSRDEAEKRFKGFAADDFEAYNENNSQDFVYNPEGGLYDKISSGSSERETDLVEVYYYQYWELETYYRAKNPLYTIEDADTVSQIATILKSMKETRLELSDEEVKDDLFDYNPTAEFLVMTSKIKSDVALVFKNFGIKFEVQEYLRKVYYSAVLSDNEVYKKFKSPDQKGFTIKFKTGAYDPINKLWMGMVDALKEPAKYSNKALTEILYVIAANSKGGVMYEKSAVQDPAKFEQQYATTKAAIQVEDGAISGGKIMPKAQAALPTGYENVYDISDRAMGEVSNINKEFLGNSQNSQVSALLENQRINQVVSTLADYFDSISLYQVEHARLMMTYIQMLAENSTGRLVKIIGKDGAQQYQQISREMLCDEYDVDIGEVPVSASQRQETSQIMMGLADKLFTAGKNIYPIAIEYIPNLRPQDKQRIIEALAPNPQEEQIQQQQAIEAAQGAKALNDAIVEGTIAKARRDFAEAQKIPVAIQKLAAETTKVLEEAHQKGIETELVKKIPISELNATI